MTGDDLTPRQYAVLRFLFRSTVERGIAPTLREIGDALGFTSTNAASDHLKALARKGYISRHPAISRGIAVTRAGRIAIFGYDPREPEPIAGGPFVCTLDAGASCT